MPIYVLNELTSRSCEGRYKLHSDQLSEAKENGLKQSTNIVECHSVQFSNCVDLRNNNGLVIGHELEYSQSRFRTNKTFESV